MNASEKIVGVGCLLLAILMFQAYAEEKKTDKCFMVGHICRFDTVYALAKEEIEAGNLGKIISMHAKRNLASWVTETHLQKLSALFGDGVHDQDNAQSQ